MESPSCRFYCADFILQILFCGFYCRIALWNCICRLHCVNSIVRIPSYFIVWISSCRFYPTLLCAFHSAHSLIRLHRGITLYGLHCAHFILIHHVYFLLLHCVHSIVRISLWNRVVELHCANYIMRIALCGLHYTDCIVITS